MKHHLKEFKRARCKSDICQYCLDYDKKVLPMCEKTIVDYRSQLEGFMPHYFEQWDSYSEAQRLSDRPALNLEALEHYISRHHEKGPCRRREGTDFPCGLGHLRIRGSGFPPRNRVELFQLEASCSLELRSLLKLVLSYNHHKAANEHQQPVLAALQAAPPENTVSLLSDWKELVSLPISRTASGEQFYATARMECSVFGASLVENIPGRGVVTSYFLVISDILDHTCLRTNQLLGMILDKRQNTNPLTSLSLMSDPGPRYRGYEALYHYAVTFVRQFETQVNIHFGVEKHSKSICDRLFGWFCAYVAKAKQNQEEILSMEALARVISDGNARQRERDPSSPHINVILGRTSPVPRESKRLVPAKMHITRTYCLSAVPDRRVKPSDLGIRLCNHVLSSKPVSVEID